MVPIDSILYLPGASDTLKLSDCEKTKDLQSGRFGNRVQLSSIYNVDISDGSIHTLRDEGGDPNEHGHE